MSKIVSINLDLDGTIADLYANENWLEQLRAYNPQPYEMAKPLVNMSLLARYIHKVQKKGIKVNVISWLSKCSTPAYDQAVTDAKLKWLRKHLPSVEFDEIHIVPYGTRKSQFARVNKENVLIDDEFENLKDWILGDRGYGITPDHLFTVFQVALK
jgi:hypothetical protein